MKLIAACEDTGSIKVVIAPHGTDTSTKPDENSAPIAAPLISTHAIENTRSTKIIHMVQSKHTNNVVVTRQNGSVELYDTEILLAKEEPKPEVKVTNQDEDVDKKEGEEEEKAENPQQSQDVEVDGGATAEGEGEGEEAEDLLPIIYEHKNVIPAFKLSSDNEMFISLIVDDAGRIVVATNKGSLFIWPSEERLNELPKKYILPLNESEVVEAVQVHPGKDNVNYIAYGGKETDLRIVRLPSASESKGEEDKEEKTTKKKGKGKGKAKKEKAKKSTDPDALEVVFKAKNLPNTHLELRSPVHIKNILFDESSTPENFKVYTFTHWGDLRYYDSAQGRKPRSSILILPKKAPITKAVWLKGDVIVCDNQGIVVKVEKSTGSQICQFKGQIGSTQALYNYKDSVLGTTGSDRYVRAYNSETRECIVKVFIGSQANNILIVEDGEKLRNTASKLIGNARDVLSKAELEEKRKIREQEKAEAEAEESDDDDELWSKLESNITQRRKRRKLTGVNA